MEKMIAKRRVTLNSVVAPMGFNTACCVPLSDKTITFRKEKIINNMLRDDIDYLLVYAIKSMVVILSI